MREVVAVGDADELGGRIAPEPPGGIEDRRERRFHVARRQIDDDVALFPQPHPHEERRDQLEVVRVDELLARI